MRKRKDLSRSKQVCKNYLKAGLKIEDIDGLESLIPYLVINYRNQHPAKAAFWQLLFFTRVGSHGPALPQSIKSEASIRNFC